jgi:hypothetical protein
MRNIMKRANRTLCVTTSVVTLIAAVAHGQGQQGGRGGAIVGGGRAGGPALPPLMEAVPTPAIASAKPVRACESLASVEA